MSELICRILKIGLVTMFALSVLPTQARPKLKKLTLVDAPLRLLSHKELMALEPNERALYLTGIRFLLADWEKWQKENRYKMIAGLPSKTETVFAEAFALLVASSAFAEEAEKAEKVVGDVKGVDKGTKEEKKKAAADSAATRDTGVRPIPDEMACIYGGWIMEVQANNFCTWPPACPGQDGFYQCNEMIMGEGACFPGRNKQERVRATSTCMKSGKTVADIASAIKGKTAEWDAFVGRFNSANITCQQERQQGPCAMVRKRLSELNLLIHGKALPEATRNPAVVMTTEKPATSEPVEPVVAAPTPTSTAADVPSGDKLDVGDGTCRNNSLLSDIGHPGKDPINVMSLEQAYNLVCRKMFDKNLVEKRRQVIRRQIAEIDKSDAAKEEYYRKFYHEMEINLNACVAEAEKPVADGVSLYQEARYRISFTDSREAKIYPAAGFVLVSKEGKKIDSSVSPASDLGYTLTLHNINICNIVTDNYVPTLYPSSPATQ